MAERCPTCGHPLEPAAPTAHRGELERQLGDPARAALLRARAARYGERPASIDIGFVGWRGMVWAPCTTRKPARCCITDAALPAGSRAWRQLSEVRDRDLRVALNNWADLL